MTPKPRILESLRRAGATVLVLPGKNGILSLRRLLRELARRDVHSVLIEGGATLAAAALRERVVDRLLLFLAPIVIGGDGRPMIAGLGVDEPSRALALRDLGTSRLGRDLLVRARLGEERAD